MISLPIDIPQGFTPTVSEKDVVTAGQVIAKKSEKRDIVISLSEVFREPIRIVSQFLLKNPGDSVKVGDTLAKKAGTLGFNSLKLESKVDGTVLRFERDTGNLVIRLARVKGTHGTEETKETQGVDGKVEDVGKVDTREEVKGDAISKEPEASSQIRSESSQDTILSPLDGTVSMCNNGQIVIDTDKDILIGNEGCGQSVTGELYRLAGGSDEKVELHHLTPECIGKIVLGRSFGRDELVKAIGIGVIGVIGTEILQKDLTHISEKNMVTPVVVLAKDDAKNLSKMKYKNVFIDGQSKTILILKA